MDNIINDPTGYANKVSAKDLEKKLRELSDLYYNTGKSQIPDEIFDLMKDILRKRDPKNKFLKEIGAPINDVISKDKITLPFPMKSLDKIKPDTSALEKWINEYKGPYVLSDKLDGASALLYKNNNGDLKMYSRGDGIKGQDLTHFIKFVMPKSVKIKEIQNNTAIRGELIISKTDFKKIADKMENARNAVAGQVNSKHPDMEVVKLMKFIAYSVVNPGYDQINQMKKLEELGFDVVVYKVEKTLTNDILSQYLVSRRGNSLYDVDGIVVVDSSKIYKIDTENPKYAFAFKAVLKDQVAETIVEDVIWSVSKDGYLKPKIKIQPVKLSGTTITYATAFNAKYVLEYKLGPGAVIKVVRSGDVIPYILEVTKPAPKPKMPDIPYKWNESGVDVLVKDIFGAQIDATSNAMKVKIMDHFFEKLEVKSIGEGILLKLVDAGYNTIQKLLLANKADLTKIDGIGDKLITKIFENLNSALVNTTLAKFMAASNIFGGGLGSKKLQLIADTYPNIMDVKWSTKEFTDKINAVPGFSDITTKKFIDNFESFKKFFDEINKIINITHLRKPIASTAVKGNKFKDAIVVFTGFRNKDYEKFVVNNGGKVSGTVSTKTTLVVYAPSAIESSKLLKAKELKIKIMTDDEFSKQYY